MPSSTGYRQHLFEHQGADSSLFCITVEVAHRCEARPIGQVAIQLNSSQRHTRGQRRSAELEPQSKRTGVLDSRSAC